MPTDTTAAHCQLRTYTTGGAGRALLRSAGSLGEGATVTITTLPAAATARACARALTLVQDHIPWYWECYEEAAPAQVCWMRRDLLQILDAGTLSKTPAADVGSAATLAELGRSLRELPQPAVRAVREELGEILRGAEDVGVWAQLNCQGIEAEVVITRALAALSDESLLRIRSQGGEFSDDWELWDGLILLPDGWEGDAEYGYANKGNSEHPSVSETRAALITSHWIAQLDCSLSVSHPGTEAELRQATAELAGALTAAVLDPVVPTVLAAPAKRQRH